jgi:hypothetical protein
MEFARATLQYHPAEKYRWFFQKECLRRFYPDFFDFAGSRNLPSDHKPIPSALREARDRVDERFAYADPLANFAALKYLSFSNKILFLLSAVVPELRRRRDWLFRPLLLLIRTRRKAEVFIRHETAKQSMQSMISVEPGDEESVERGMA